MKHIFSVLILVTMSLTVPSFAHNPGGTFPILYRVDNLPASYPDNRCVLAVVSIVDSLYYSKSKLKIYKPIVEVDFKRQVRIVHVRSSKAFSGYLFINSRVYDLITELHLDCPKVRYNINGHAVDTEDEVLALLALKSERISELLIRYIDESNCVIVSVDYYTGKIRRNRS